MEIEKMVDMLGTKVCDYCIHNDRCCGDTICHREYVTEPPCCDSEYEEILDVDAMREFLTEEGLIMPAIKGVWFNRKKGITVVKWEDDSITKVSTQNDDLFDGEKGIALCFMKKMCGNTGKYNEILKQYITDYERDA